MSDSERVRALVIEAVDAAAELIGRPVVAERWDDPSALAGMTVGALCAHLVRAAGATIAYLDRTPPDARPVGDLLTPITYFRAALEAPIHGQIRAVSADESSIGAAAMAAKCATLATDLRTRLADESDGRLVAALGGRMLTLDDFGRTRLIEVLTHLDDLAVSVDEVRPATDPEGVSIVIDVLVGISREVHGDWSVVHALSRGERAPADVFPVF